MLEEGDNLVLRAHITCGLDIFCLEDSLVDEAAKYNERYVDLRQQYNQSLGHKVERAEYLILSNAYNNLGNAYCAQGKFEKALQTHKMSLDLRLTHNEPLYITLSQANISRVLQFMGRLPDSMSHMETALRLQGLLTGVQDARYALYLHNVGSLLGYMQHWTKAKSVHSEALTIRTAKVNEANDTAVSQHMVADCCFHLGQYDSACDLLEASIQTFKIGLDSQDRGARSTFKLAQAKEKLGKTSEADDLYGKAAAIRRTLLKYDEVGVVIPAQEKDYNELTVYMHR